MPPYLPDLPLEDIAAALDTHFPGVTGAVTLLGRGWDYYAYLRGDVVFRLPRHAGAIERFDMERRLLDLLALRLPVPIPIIEYVQEDVIDGRPVHGYRLVPGTPLEKLPPAERPRLGSELGAFLKAQHSVPVELAQDIGVKGGDTQAWRTEIEAQYDQVRRQAFPLLTDAGRRYGEKLFEAYLADDANFRFKPAILHSDLYVDHILADDDDDGLAGVIDFGDVRIGDPAFDFTWLLANDGSHSALASIGASGVEAHLAAYGPESRSFRPRALFSQLSWDFVDILASIYFETDKHIQSGVDAIEKRAREGV
jgi:aminoglycoside phosphotransferase (APT) family kinase protein